MKKIVIVIVIVIVILAGALFFVWQKAKSFFSFQQEEKQIQNLLEERRSQNLNGEGSDPFGADGLVKILFIGLDNRIGQTTGHCDAIQFMEINKAKSTITITAVPRGTYSPLPGSGHLPTDYYVSKACEIGGLDYGVKQIEKILGQKADYVIFLGFSEAMGIFRELDLPADETMQWLRVRQGYAIGEPQRARNHSNFIKQMLIKYTPELNSKFTQPIKYLIYKLTRTDLSFKQAVVLSEAIAKIDLPNNPGRIQLLMRPAYDVQDIYFDPEKVNDKINALIKPIAKIIPEGAYTGETKEASQQKILDSIKDGWDNPDFIRWAYDNYLWLQIEDDNEREITHYNLLEKYVSLLTDQKEQDSVIADYIIEMENQGLSDWSQKGRDLLEVKRSD